MCRCARVKFEEAIFHIMARCSSDNAVFKLDLDKRKFLEILQKYKNIFQFKVVAFCIMDTHYHLEIDTNGADISKIMHGINQSYAQYYNHINNRIGHVFQDRFTSKVITSEEYFFKVSDYIHKNPKDLVHFKDNIELYPYSSLGIYSGKFQDEFNLLEGSVLWDRYKNDIKEDFKFANSVDFIEESVDIDNDISSPRLQNNYISRNINPQFIIEFVSNHISLNISSIDIKKKLIELKIKSLCTSLIYTFSNRTYKEIGELLGYITPSSISYLSNLGYKLLWENNNYKNLVTTQAFPKGDAYDIIKIWA